MQSDKDKEQQPGQPPQQDAGGGMPPPPPPPKKKGLFGAKGPKKLKGSKSKQPKPLKPPKPPKPPREKKVKPPKTPRQKKVKPPKGPKKPLFSFGKKKSRPEPAPYEAPAAPTAAMPGAPAGAPPVAAEAASEAKPKKSLFGGKKERAPKPPRARKEKKPKPERTKKPKAVKVKKPKPPRGQKKPMFSFGKKKGEGVVTAAEPDRLSPAGEAAEDVEASGSKGMFSKKGPKQPRVKEPKGPRAKKAKPAGGGFGSSKTSPVGLDIGRSSMTAVRLKYQTGGSILLQAANDSLPEGLIQEGEVRDVEALSYAIREFWKTHNIKGKKVALGLANQKVVVRTLEFPLLDPKELRSAIEFQAQDYIPIPIEEAVFDFHVLGRFADEDGVEKQKVLVVAAQKVMVMDFINAIKGAKLSIAGVDLQAFALLRALAPISFLDQGPGDRATAIANIGSDVTNLVVDMGGEPQFTRIISFGGDDFTKALQDMQGISFIEAEQLKAETGLSDPALRVAEPEITQELPKPGEPPIPAPGIEFDPATGYGPGPAEPGAEGGGAEDADAPKYTPGPAFEPPEKGTGEGEPAEAGVGGPSEKPEEGPWPAGPPIEAETEQETKQNVQRTLESVADSLADEIRRSLDYYMSQEQAAPIGRLLISGGGAMLKNLDAHLSQLFPFTVETGNPLMRVSDNKSDLTDEQLQALSPQLAIAIGLALEDEG
ncbi:MAG: type IV pilus assembly protein PilM [Actinobacteria bacterium]|nr:type IV pilus assembly protein PilM [Actinomycetota bacterium]